MFKKIIAPVQAWLLSQGKCVGCGKPLDKGKGEKRKDKTEKVTCRCGRIFIYNPETKRYRRALFEEV
ncbi:MAG TPA: hypothetical protein VMW41_01400 [Candidatus Bathyarchaeia archaeon]|nr:hypothetical protein [Candidatus Bathyarchaeia archaeon]